MSAKNTYSSWWILTHSKLRTLCETLDEISNNRKELIQKNFIHTDVLLREVKAALSDYLFFKQLFEEELESVAYNTSEMQSLESTIENDLMVFSEIQKAIDKFNFYA